MLDGAAPGSLWPSWQSSPLAIEGVARHWIEGDLIVEVRWPSAGLLSDAYSDDQRREWVDGTRHMQTVDWGSRVEAVAFDLGEWGRRCPSVGVAVSGGPVEQRIALAEELMMGLVDVELAEAVPIPHPCGEALPFEAGWLPERFEPTLRPLPWAGCGWLGLAASGDVTVLDAITISIDQDVEGEPDQDDDSMPVVVEWSVDGLGPRRYAIGSVDRSEAEQVADTLMSTGHVRPATVAEGLLPRPDGETTCAAHRFWFAEPPGSPPALGAAFGPEPRSGQYAANWSVGDVELELRLPASQAIDYVGEDTEVRIVEGWGRLRVRRRTDGAVSLVGGPRSLQRRCPAIEIVGRGPDPVTAEREALRSFQQLRYNDAEDTNIWAICGDLAVAPSWLPPAADPLPYGSPDNCWWDLDVDDVRTDSVLQIRTQPVESNAGEEGSADGVSYWAAAANGDVDGVWSRQLVVEGTEPRKVSVWVIADDPAVRTRVIDGLSPTPKYMRSCAAAPTGNPGTFEKLLEVDGDGLIDSVTVVDGLMHLCLGASGRLAPVAVDGAENGVTIIDIDLDGRDEIVVTYDRLGGWAGHLYVFDKGALHRVDLPDDEPLELVTRFRSTGLPAAVWGCGDLDEDGRRDVLIATLEAPRSLAWQRHAYAISDGAAELILSESGERADDIRTEAERLRHSPCAGKTHNELP